MKIYKFKKSIIAVILASFFLIPGLSFATSSPPSPCGDGLFEEGIDCTNPQLADLEIYANNVLNILIAVAGPLALLAIIYSGILFMTSAGDEKKVTQAKAVMKYTLIGVAVIAGSKGLISLVTFFINS